jgi:hypothetical protein
MSVLVITTMKADTAAFERLHRERTDDLRSVMQQAKAAGAVHHRFGVGEDGTVVIIDEWKTSSDFQQFFDNPTVASFMQEAGVTEPPDVTIVTAFDSVDQF